MKTLIFNGSPRINGDTSSLIKKITEKIPGEYRIVNAYRCNISPCLDCRYCRKNKGCSINDEMQEIYKYIQECDNILIASPLYFSELTGKLLDVGSRLQTYFCARFFRKEEPIVKSKKGAIILVGGGDGHIDTAYGTACTLLHHMNCYDIHEAVYSHSTNERPAVDDENALIGLNSILKFFANKEETKQKENMYRIIKTEEKDLKEILELQYIAFKSEAEMIGSTDIPALKQTYEGIVEDFHNGMVLKMINEEEQIIGSVRAFEREDSVEIAKLMVHPDYRRKGLATLLLKEIEKYYRGKRLELYTCTRSLCNIVLYERAGYTQYKTISGDSELDFVYLEKFI